MHHIPYILILMKLFCATLCNVTYYIATLKCLICCASEMESIAVFRPPT